MWLKRIAPIRHGSVSIHDIVSVTRAVGLTNTTEVDVGVAVWVCRDPDVVLVLKRDSSLCGDRLFVFTSLSACRLQSEDLRDSDDVMPYRGRLIYKESVSIIKSRLKKATMIQIWCWK